MPYSEDFSRFEDLYWHVSRSMNYIWKKIFDHQFPGSQSYIIFLLEKRNGMKMTEMAEALNITPGAVTSSSDKLICGGYIRRTRDENDRRVVFLEITDKGKETLEELRKEGRKAVKAIFGGASEEDVRHLIRIYEHAAENIDRVREEMDEWNICQKKRK